MAYRMRVIPKVKHRIMRPSGSMKTPYGLQVIENCLTCPLVKDRIFCDLSQPTLAALDSISFSATYPKDAILFVEGQDSRGVFVLCNGRVKLSTTSADGNTSNMSWGSTSIGECSRSENACRRSPARSVRSAVAF